MINPLILIQRIWFVWAFLVLTFITISSLWPLEGLPAVPGNDKSHHLIAYAVLMFPVALRRPDYWRLIGVGFIVYSGFIELVQPYVNRYGEWLDLAANVLGIVCGWLLAELAFRLFPGLSRGEK